MRESAIASCEEDFILFLIKENRRIDLRNVDEPRSCRIHFGSERGVCEVNLGSTSVLACVSAELAVPKYSRPHEGLLFVNLKLSTLASENFIGGRVMEKTVKLNSILEKCIIGSSAMDMESLCVIAGESVWSVRVDLNIMNHCGNILDCASIAAMAALKHFHLPEVSVEDGIARIRPKAQSTPQPLQMIHSPFTVTTAFFLNGQYSLLDPSMDEERLSQGALVVGMNRFREICVLQAMGSVSLNQDQVRRCVTMAWSQVRVLQEKVTSALEADENLRKTGGPVGFAYVHGKLKDDKIEGFLKVSAKSDSEAIELDESECEVVEENISESNISSALQQLREDAVEVGTGKGSSAWEAISVSSENVSDSDGG